MKKQNKILISIIALFLLTGLFFGISKLTAPKTSEGSKQVVVEVVNKESESKKYEIKTDSKYLSDLMDELQSESDFSYEASNSEYGMYIESVNGEKADYSSDGAYWAIYVNGEYGQFGADQQPVNDGETYSFVYEVSKN